jgi:hypothetical protein
MLGKRPTKRRVFATSIAVALLIAFAVRALDRAARKEAKAARKAERDRAERLGTDGRRFNYIKIWAAPHEEGMAFGLKQAPDINWMSGFGDHVEKLRVEYFELQADDGVPPDVKDQLRKRLEVARHCATEAHRSYHNSKSVSQEKQTACVTAITNLTRAIENARGASEAEPD